MRMGLSFKFLLVFFLFLLVHFSSASVRSCCRFKHLDQCQVFRRDGTSYCTQETEQGNFNGCPRSNGERKKRVPANIHSVAVNYQIDRCLSLKISNDGDSCPQYHSHGFITLNVSFALGSPAFSGILFQVVSSKDILRGPSCHRVYLNDSVQLEYGDLIENKKSKIFYFAGFDEDFIPKESYYVDVRVLPTPQNDSLNLVYSQTISIPDCNHLPDDIYYCSLPSAAKWVSNITTTVLEDLHGVNVSFTINNNTVEFTDYEIKLWRLPGNETIETRLVLNNKNNWYCDDQSCVMHETFDVDAGNYYVTVQANNDEWRSSQACRKDPYRAQTGCRIAYSATFVVEPVLITFPSATVPTELTTSEVAATSPPHRFPLWLVVVVVVLLVAAAITCCGAPLCVRLARKQRYGSVGDETVSNGLQDWEPKTLILQRPNGQAVNSIGHGLSTGDFSEYVTGTSDSVSGNHISDYTYVPLMRPTLVPFQRMGTMDIGLFKYNSLLSGEPDGSHSDEGYSENGAQISPDGDWPEGRNPPYRQDSGISMVPHPAEDPLDIVAISEGIKLPEGGQQTHLNGVKYDALAQGPLSETVTPMVTTV